MFCVVEQTYQLDSKNCVCVCSSGDSSSVFSMSKQLIWLELFNY